MGKILSGAALACISLLGACGSEESAGPVAETIRSCDSIRADIIDLARTRGVTIVKIYEPKTIINEPKLVSCSGRVVLSTRQETTLFYSNYEDQEGDWLLEYSDEPLT